MTVETTTNRVQYDTNGTTGPWTVPFYFLESSHLGVTYADSAGTPTDLVLTADYSVTGAGDSNGGTVTTVSAYAAGGTITIVRDVPVLQETDYTETDAFPAESHERALDLLTMICQQFDEVLARALVTPVSGDTPDPLPIAANRLDRLLAFDITTGQPEMSSFTATEVASAIAAAYAAGSTADAVTFIHSFTGALSRSVQDRMRDTYRVTDAMSTAQIADVRARTKSLDVTSKLQALLDVQDTGTAGAFTVHLPDGGHLISGTGAQILEVQDGTKVVGSALEGTNLWVDAGSTATAVIQDDGSAAKIELSNMQIQGQGNTSLTSGIKLGATTQFGTYGTLDNIMVRDMPNAVGFALDTNIAAVGKLYTMDTKSGLVSDPGGTGLHVETFTPLGFTEFGAKLAAGDSINFLEAEAPGADAAIPLVFERGGSVGTFILSIGTGRVVKTPVQINDTYFLNYSLGPTHTVYTDATSKFGDTASPAVSSTTTAVGTRSFTDTTQTWRVDQFKGGALHIVIGGSSRFYEIDSNDVNTLYIVGSIWPASPGAPLVGAAYSLDYFIKKAGGGGFAHSDSGSRYEVVGHNFHCTNEARINAATIGLRGTPGRAPTVASANTIAPTRPVNFISGTTLVKTITVPSLFSIGGGRMTLIPTGAFTWDATGNIAISGTAVVSKALDMTYDAGTAKWYPSYV